MPENASRFRLIGCLFTAAVCANATFVGNPGALNPNDQVTWNQLGNPGDPIPGAFSAASGAGITVAGSFAGPTGGTVAQVCPATSCNWGPAAPGFNPGDFLVWTEDANANETGPLRLSTSIPVKGMGLYLQMTAPGTFTATIQVGPNPAGESVNSDSSGDPVFLGDLDPTADINSITVSIVSCTPSTPGGCSPADFAVDTLFLATPIPEPATSLPVFGGLALLLLISQLQSLRRTMANNRTGSAMLFCAGVLAFGVKAARAQDPVPLPPGGGQYADGTAAVRELADMKVAVDANVQPPANVTAGLPIWSYQIKSPVDGNTYSGYMVGQSPFNRGARTTTVPVVLIPVIVVFHNITSGFTATFDPTSTPDAGCTAGQTAFSLVESSPIFQNNPWTLNGVNVGNTQYVDAFQRANFWQYVQNTGNAYHTMLSYTVGNTMTLAVSYSAASLDHEVDSVPAGSCTNPTSSGVTNGGGYTGVVNINTVDAALNAYIAAHGITPNEFPLFIMYNVVMSLPQQPGFFDGGYHASQEPYPAGLTSPGQTYAIAGFQTNEFFNNHNLNTGSSILSHEVAEWMDDPGVRNATPSWGHIGQTSGCQNNLEVGDALTGTNLPGIAGPNGFTYDIQELVFYSWFFRTPSIGAGGKFSDNGTFTSDAGAVCQ